MGKVVMESVLSIMFTVLTVVMATPQGIDPHRIYTPDDLEELNAAIAYEKCLETPGCNPNRPQERGTRRCQLGSGVNTILKDVMNMQCNPFAGEVLWPPTGSCVRLLTQGPCPRGQWVKLTNPGLEPVCERVPCDAGLADVGRGQCVSPRRAVTMCPPTQQLVINEFGVGECDCAPGLVYYTATKTCYTPYTQGPCPPRHIIKVVDEGMRGLVKCMANPCPQAQMAMVNSQCEVQTRAGADTTCHPLDTPGPCTSGTFTVDNILSEAVCVETHSIFNLPNLKACARGSIRDSRGRCRRNFSLLLQGSQSFVTSAPLNRPDGRICPPGYTFLGGTCLRRVSRRSTPTKPS
ncbi:uncharacterized protein [Cherax quadricarinatus]|nr:uncharacterized protein LOC128689517 [Cherax quadricarinatus]